MNYGIGPFTTPPQDAPPAWVVVVVVILILGFLSILGCTSAPMAPDPDCPTAWVSFDMSDPDGGTYAMATDSITRWCP